MSEGIGAIPYSPQPESNWETRIDVGSVRDAFHQLEKRVDRQSAVIMALSDIVREQTAWSTEELLVRVQSLIAAERTTAIRKCPDHEVVLGVGFGGRAAIATAVSRIGGICASQR